MITPTRRPTVSVVIPVRDDADHLRRCLGALAGQTVAPDEIIIVDNDSTDDSAAVAVSFGARVVAEPIVGIAAASATGYDSAASDLIARLDADSVPDADWIERIVETFARHPEASAITGGARFVDGPAGLRRLGELLYVGAYFLSMTIALGHPPIFGSNAAFRRSVWLEVRGSIHRYDTLMHDDIDLAVHIGPARIIHYERRLGMGISMRPLTNLRTAPLRTRRGFHSLTGHWPHDLPWLRWFRRGRALWRSGVRADDGQGLESPPAI